MLISEHITYFADGMPFRTGQEANEHIEEVIAERLRMKWGPEDWLTPEEILELIDFIVENAEAIKGHVR